MSATLFPARTLIFAALPAVVACGGDKYEQSAFSKDYAEAVCTLYEQCEVLTVAGQYADADECNIEVSAEVDGKDGCTGFNEVSAIDCVDALNTLQCTELFDGDWPEECDKACKDGAADHRLPTDE